MSQLKQVHLLNAVRQVSKKFFFLYTTKTCLIAVWPGSANQKAGNQKAGYQAAKLARPDMYRDVTGPQTGNVLCNTIARKTLETGP